MVVYRLHEYRLGGTTWGAWLGFSAGICWVQAFSIRGLLQVSELRASTLDDHVSGRPFCRCPLVQC